jgi:hypothetical protein
VLLRDIAHVRTGDKGDTAQLSVIAHDLTRYSLLTRSVTCDVIRQHLLIDDCMSIVRHELPGLGALSFVITGLLRGGVTRSLALDPHGKTTGAQLLNLNVGDFDE